jgi:ferredoxin
MSIELYYFTGTGNSLRVAKELQKRIPEIELRPIAALWNREGLASARYAFSVVTRAGSAERANRMVERLVGKKGRMLDASWVVTMPGNCEGAFVYGVPTRELCAEQEARMMEKVGRIADTIAARRRFRERDEPPFSLRDLVGPVVAPLMLPVLAVMSGLIDKLDINIKYLTDSTCSGCGVCEKVCTSGKIAMEGGRPAWRKDVRCFICFACYNYCPSASILVDESTTDKNRRYRHRLVSASDIAAQKG